MFEVAHAPAITHPANRAAGAGILRAATRDGAAVLRTGLHAASRPYGQIAASWQVQPRPGGAWGVLNTHPGAAPLNHGARWPGAMPPWGPGSALAAWAAARGRVPYLVARRLKAAGLRPRHFADAGRDAAHDQVVQTIQRRGVQVWLGRLSHG